MRKIRALIRFVDEEIIYRWEVSTIWSAAHDGITEEIPLLSLESELDKDRWYQGYDTPTIKSIVHHFERVQRADLKFPIILSPGGFVLDGIHRIIKARLEGRTTILAIRLKQLPPSDFFDDAPFHEKPVE
jgi:hypothetical protein